MNSAHGISTSQAPREFLPKCEHAEQEKELVYEANIHLLSFDIKVQKYHKSIFIWYIASR